MFPHMFIYWSYSLLVTFSYFFIHQFFGFGFHGEEQEIVKELSKL